MTVFFTALHLIFSNFFLNIPTHKSIPADLHVWSIIKHDVLASALKRSQEISPPFLPTTATHLLLGTSAPDVGWCGSVLCTMASHLSHWSPSPPLPLCSRRWPQKGSMNFLDCICHQSQPIGQLVLQTLLIYLVVSITDYIWFNKTEIKYQFLFEMGTILWELLEMQKLKTSTVFLFKGC